MSEVQTRIESHLRIPLYRNGYALVLSTGITSSLGFLYWVLAARLYPTETVGLNSAALSSMMFLAGLAQFSLSGVLVRFIPRARRAAVALIDTATIVTIAAGLLAGLAFVLGIELWAPSLGFLRASPWLAAGFALSTAAWGVFALQEGVLTGLRQATWVPVRNAGFAVGKIALLVLFATLFPGFGIFASWMAPAGLATVALALLLRRGLRARLSEETPQESPGLIRSRVLQYAVANYASTLFLLAATMSLPLLVTEVSGPTANAYFFLAWTVANTLYLIAPSMGSSLIVEAALDPERMGVDSRRALLQTVRLVLPLAALLVVTAPIVLAVLGKGYAEEGTTLLRLLALAAIPNIVNTLYASIARVQRRMAIVVGISAALCISMLTLSYLLLNLIGITGVGLAWLISQSLTAGVLLLARRRLLQMPGRSTDL